MSDLGLLRGLITLVTLLTFLGICWWAYRPSNRGRFDEDAWLAFDEEEVTALDGKGIRLRASKGERA
jgi:cytochrome c oxidase cbb3-type subunit 4